MCPIPNTFPLTELPSGQTSAVALLAATETARAAYLKLCDEQLVKGVAGFTVPSDAYEDAREGI
jgi:hypothetical protein